jgi:hypothetical protein
MIRSFNAPFGSSVSLDCRGEFGELVELESFQFVTPPVEFRLTRSGVPLHEWQAGNTEMYDLQHCPGIKEWARDAHWFTNDLDHRHDVVTCGVLARDLVMETRGLALSFVLLVWLRESTCRSQRTHFIQSAGSQTD